MTVSAKKKHRDERGSIMALAAVAMLSILLAAGLGVDISRFYAAKNELQNAADAAALAAASALNSSSSGISNARDRAIQEMNKYNFNNGNVSIPDANIVYGVNLEGSYVDFTNAYNTPGNIRFVQVTTPQLSIPVSFAAMVLGNSRNLSATATAGLSVPLNTFCNFIPLSVIDYDIPMVPGQTYTIRADTGGSPSPGNYQILAVAGPGGVDVGFGIGAGVDACASPGETYSVDTKPGLTAGKVRTGLNSRFDDYQGSQLDATNEPPDTNIKEGISHADYLKARDPMDLEHYHNSTIYSAPANPGIDDRRVVLIPIVKLAQYDAGRGTVTFDRFGAFFLKTKAGGGNGGELQAEYIDTRFAVGKGRYIPGGAVGNPLLATPVLYK